MSENINNSDQIISAPVVPAPKPSRPRRTWILLMVILLIILGVGAGLFWQLQKINIQNMALEEHMDTLQDAIFLTAHKQVDQSKKIALLRTDLQRYQSQLTSSGWGLAEAEYLVNSALFNLQIEKNPQVASQILQAADEKIQQLNQVSLLPARQALASDIAALNAVPMVDLPGIIVQINALSNQLETLPRMQKVADNAAAKTMTHPLPATASWQDKTKAVLVAIGENLRSLVVIRHEAPNAIPLLPPDQYAYLITNIQTQLTMAQWAALHQQPKIYQQSLQQAKIWITRYFSPDTSAVKAILQRLQELAQVDIAPDLPDLSHSLQAVEQAQDKAI